VEGRQESGSFCKKEPKNFYPLECVATAGGRLAREAPGKSLLVLFFRKEHLACS
jgi:hypothetical protein